MTAPTLNISSTLSLPLELVTSSNAILGKKGSGKTSAAIVVFEEMFAAGVPVVSVDPKGDHYGIRSSADGKGPGLPVPVLGGQHGDVPLEPTAGAVVADLILDQRLSCVLDVSEFSRAEVIRFLLPFAQRLYRQAGDEPLHLLLEECHEYLPQVVRAEDAQMVGAWQRLVKMGRFKGLGVTLVSQRSAAVNKDVLEQVDNLIVLRTTGPRDRDAIERWIDTHADRKDIMASLPSLANGEAWLWQPERGEPVRFRFRMRHTYDAGATPEIGKARRPPSTLADVDLAAIKESMAETIEKAKADDPKHLKAQVADLTRKLAAANEQISHLADASVVEVIERVEVPVLGREAMDRLVAFCQLADDVHQLRDDVLGIIEREAQRDRQDVPRARPAGRGVGSVGLEAPKPAQRPDPTQRREPRRAAVPGTAVPAGPGSLLRVLAGRYPAWLTRRQVVTLAKRGPKSSALNDHFGYLLDNGLAEVNVNSWRATDVGLEAMGAEPAVDPIEAWHGAFSGATQKVFDALVRVYPERYTKDGIADLAGLSRTSSSVGQALTELRRNGLVEDHHDGTQAADILFEGRP